MKEKGTSKQKHDIFISYRRDGGVDLATRIKTNLESKGFSVFMDIEDLKSGQFNKELLFKIENATDFILVLTKDCLERCKNEDDWLRMEIAHAYKMERNIIPVYATGFNLSDLNDLPSDINELRVQNGMASYNDLFGASMDRLASVFLKSRPKNLLLKIIEKNTKIFFWVLFLVVLWLIPFYLIKNYGTDIKGSYQKVLSKIKSSDSKRIKEWSLYKSEEGWFSILVPRIPLKNIVLAGNSEEINLKMKVGKATEFVIAYKDLNSNAGSEFSLVDSLSKEILNKEIIEGGRLRKQNYISLNGYSGKELIIDLPDSSTTISRNYLVEKRSILLKVTWRKAEDSTMSASYIKFFESFKLLPEEVFSSIDQKDLITTLRLPDMVNNAIFSPDGKFLASSGQGGVIRIWDVKSWIVIDSIPARFTPIAFSPDSKNIASFNGRNYNIMIHGLQGPKIRNTFFCSIESSIKFSPDGRYIASGGMAKRVAVWDITSNKLVKNLDNSTATIESISFSPDGQLLVAGSFDGSVSVWDFTKGKIFKVVRGVTKKEPFSPGVQCLSFSPDGSFVAIADPGDIKIYNLLSGKIYNTFTGHKGLISCLSYSPDGKYLASSSFDRSVIIWNLENGEIIKKLIGHIDGVVSVSFSNDGKLLASGSWDNTVKIWNTSFLYN